MRLGVRLRRRLVKRVQESKQDPASGRDMKIGHSARDFPRPEPWNRIAQKNAIGT
jgi:hypothetical protein